jgi:hypothetical protein
LNHWYTFFITMSYVKNWLDLDSFEDKDSFFFSP